MEILCIGQEFVQEAIIHEFAYILNFKTLSVGYKMSQQKTVLC